ncbi:unnamed protein product [Paramecium primaurelia]|uniref:Uncharacterized protein n=1 Tax=Paramecium primaurelia TaxID=5886 RepID=A0A8S1K447_PARPR|nr:unnamed protein product [Paramecium primaurelia]
MRKLEKEEEKSQYQTPEKSVFHLCIVNLVIGTLYYSKNNYAFGIFRVIKSLEPYNKKINKSNLLQINTDTWYYVKRCFLALIEKIFHIMKSWIFSMQLINMANLFPLKLIHQKQLDDKNTVSYEARMIKRMFLKLRT